MNRDENAAVNIYIAGCSYIIYGTRPLYLEKPSQDVNPKYHIYFHHQDIPNLPLLRNGPRYLHVPMMTGIMDDGYTQNIFSILEGY